VRAKIAPQRRCARFALASRAFLLKQQTNNPVPFLLNMRRSTLIARTNPAADG